MRGMGGACMAPAGVRPGWLGAGVAGGAVPPPVGPGAGQDGGRPGRMARGGSDLGAYRPSSSISEKVRVCRSSIQTGTSSELSQSGVTPTWASQSWNSALS